MYLLLERKGINAMNMQSRSDSYAAAGVDITAGYRAVELMKTHIAKTMTAGALSDIGGFGGLFELDLTGISRPVLVSGTDGVGTKLKLAFLMDKHDTVGIDCVAMCVNDIICVGAKPLFFLDYIACGKNIPEKIADIVSGVAEGCVQSGVSLIGGETAEMPGFYPVDEYDLAGFSVGVVDKAKVFDKTTIQPGDVILGLPSSGVHSNGFSLVRKVLDVEHADLKAPVEALGGRSLGETLLTPTRIYVKSILALMEQVQIKSVSHITGGGFYENIPRSLPQGMTAKIKEANVPVLPIFTLIEKAGSVPRREMFNTFNMGIGMTVVVAREEGLCWETQPTENSRWRRISSWAAAKTAGTGFSSRSPMDSVPRPTTRPSWLTPVSLSITPFVRWDGDSLSPTGTRRTPSGPSWNGAFPWSRRCGPGNLNRMGPTGPPAFPDCSPRTAVISCRF